MQFSKSCIPVLAAGLIISVAAGYAPVQAFSIKSEVQSSVPKGGEGDEVNNPELERAAYLEARAYICGTSEASETAMRKGMKETGLPEVIAVEIVSDLASGIIDQAVKTKSQKICGKAEVQLSHF
ncbi:hypothetical protein [Phyllobacterium sp. UNC302MFCol5.2]|uniref:hypothetical protein n=1 Tax=Phyllobacterium sp. UNC302MFCol5.2 TaxID=1449065 RepID=UPI00048020A8|nr:hypothetical protein [Phyllobacterium sp. UNC302MFCol5.2]